MDLSRLIQMIINTLMRRMVNKGVDMGINYAAKRGKPDADMTPEDHEQARAAKEMAKRARQAANLARKIGR